MTLFADNHLSFPSNILELLGPLGVLARIATRLLVLEVIFLSKNEQHHVRVLFDRTGFAKIGELRTLVVALLDLARKLRERQDRNIELLGQRLEAGGDFGQFLHAIVAARFRSRQKLQIVDNEKIEAALAFQAPRPRR